MDLNKFFEDIEDDFDIDVFDDPATLYLQQALDAFSARVGVPAPFTLKDMETHLYNGGYCIVLAKSPPLAEDSFLGKILGRCILIVEVDRGSDSEVIFKYTLHGQLGMIEIGKLKLNKNNKPTKSGFKIP